MRRWTAVLAAAAVLAVPATTVAQEMADHDAEAKAAVEAGSQMWVEAFNASDAAALTALYADDATLMAPGAPAATGHEAIHATFVAALEAAPGFAASVEAKSVHVMGDMAVEVGGWVMTDADGGHADHGSYMAVWRNVDGEWKFAYDMWNSSMPASDDDM
ncbi:MAG: nuclear transport factor 2 family protein [Gemmatimonadota bacterium]